MRPNPNRFRIALVAAFGALLVATPAVAADLNVQWGDNHETLTFTYDGQPVVYPADIAAADYDAGDGSLVFVDSRDWPVVSCYGRWTVSTADWPEEQRQHILDFVLLRLIAADTFAFHNPDKLKDTRILEAPQPEVEPGRSYVLNMRGQTMQYTMTAIVESLLANDSVIVSRMRLGASDDGKTIFYHDTAESISDNHKGRDFFLAVHDAGDHLRFEVRGVYVCKSSLAQGEVMKKTVESVRYVVERWAGRLGNPPSAQEIDDHTKVVIEGVDFSEVSAASAERLGPPQRAEKGLPKEVMLIGGGILAALLVIDLLLLILMIVLLVRVGRLRRELRKKDD
jgi:hypothetical protein